MKTVIPDFVYTPDPHRAVLGADFAPLDRLYAGRTVAYGDYHAHARTGGTSDGKTTLAEWKEHMRQLKIDFVGIMDHRQVRHQYLEDFDPDLFLYGTEPAMSLTEPATSLHYLMIFPHQTDLEEYILDRFPSYQFTGGAEGHFKYVRMPVPEFKEIVQAVLDCGGAFCNAHPMQTMRSDNIDDYVFAEKTALETIYAGDFHEPLNEHTVANYRLWTALLARGHKVYTTATADIHGVPFPAGVNTLYTDRKTGASYIRYLRQGDVNAGFIGLQFAVGDTPMGGETAFRPGMTLTLRAADPHPIRFNENDRYRVDVITDRGLAYTLPLDAFPFTFAMEVQDRKFYRVEVIRESDGMPAAISQPVWLS